MARPSFQYCSWCIKIAVEYIIWWSSILRVILKRGYFLWDLYFVLGNRLNYLGFLDMFRGFHQLSDLSRLPMGRQVRLKLFLLIIWPSFGIWLVSPKREGRIIVSILSSPLIIIFLSFIYNWPTALIFIIISIWYTIGTILRSFLINISWAVFMSC